MASTRNELSPHPFGAEDMRKLCDFANAPVVNSYAWQKVPSGLAARGTDRNDIGGAFFLYDEKTDQYVVAEPPVGTEVPYLPEGYTVETVSGVEYYKLGPTYYRPDIAGDDEVIVVSKV